MSSAARTAKGRGRRALLYATTLSIGSLLALLTSEVSVRVLAPRATWSISNVYRGSEIPGVIYTYRPDFEGMAFGAGLKTNSLGFRGGEWRKEGADAYRVALVGDSYAFGFGVGFEETVGQRLASMLEERLGEPTEVLNLGVNGYNARQQLAIVESLALDYAPDLLVLIPTDNDHKPAMRADAKGWLHWDGQKENEKSRIRSGESPLERLPGWVRESRLVAFLSVAHLRAQGLRIARSRPMQPLDREWRVDVSPGPVSKRLLDSVYAPLTELLKLAATWRLPVVLAPFCIPEDYRQMFHRLARDHGVPLVELLLLFPEAHTREELTAAFGLGWDDHLNATAHRRFAGAIADIVADRRLYASGS